MWVVVIGNLGNGIYSVHGPFKTQIEAEEWSAKAEDLGTADTFVYEVDAPEVEL